MAIGERINFFRNMRGMTQKYLGMQVGFSEKSADVRLAQYETGTRTPKTDLTTALADTLDVSPQALAVPDIDSYIGLMHTLFTLEDRYGLHIDEADGEICLKVDVRKNKDAAQLHEMLCAWRQAAAMLKAGENPNHEIAGAALQLLPYIHRLKRRRRISSKHIRDIPDALCPAKEQIHAVLISDFLAFGIQLNSGSFIRCQVRC